MRAAGDVDFVEMTPFVEYEEDLMHTASEACKEG